MSATLKSWRPAIGLEMHVQLQVRDAVDRNPSKLTYDQFPEDAIEAIEPDSLLKLAKERNGVDFLLDRFPTLSQADRHKIFHTVLQPDAFNDLIDHSSGNFLIQGMIGKSSDAELIRIEEMLSKHLFKFCSGQYGCRVVQRMIEQIQLKCPSRLSNFIGLLTGHEYELALAQTGSHVLQKIFKDTSFHTYEFILKAFVKSSRSLEAIVEDKYGCRVIQLALQQLRGELERTCNCNVSAMFNKIVGIMKERPQYFISHQYANYIMQDLLYLEMKDLENLSQRDLCMVGSEALKRAVITNTIVSNILSLSQEKHASHVVQKAFTVAPEWVLSTMMDEVFDGYESDREGNDALNVLMFDQYGNYVVQTMIDVALSVKNGNRKGKIEWYNRLVKRVNKLQNRLFNFSSGKRIIAKLGDAGALSVLNSANAIGSFSSIPEKFH